jgi:8-amino-7-oxononanoate synthase
MSDHSSPLQMTSAPGARTHINHRELDYFCGTGYYALHNHPDMIAAAHQAMDQYGIGSATTRTGFGNNPVLLDVEAKAAQFFDTEQALYYVSGYLGNAVLLQGLSPQYDLIFVDEQAHYSVTDGAAMARKPIITFAHCNPQDLADKLQAHCQAGQRPLVITDGIFPTSGVIPPLLKYHELLNSIEGAILCVDDAHATGVLGKKGQGTFEYCGVSGPRRYSSGTLSKALGGHGGIIAGTAEFVQGLQNNSMIVSGSSSVPVPAAAASAKALEIIQAQPQLREQLWANVARAKKAFRALGFENIPDTPVPIICLSGEGLDLSGIQQRLFEQGMATFYVPSGSYSSVPEGGAIRIAIFSSHSALQIDALVEAVRQCL